ncbi:MAG: hypothetical protein WDN30_14040 [Pararobbsia sp.]
MAIEGNEIDLNNIPSDPAEALKLLEQLEAESNDEGQTTPAQPPVAAAPVVAAPAAKAPEIIAPVSPEPGTETQQSTATSEDDAAGVATKDGKHVIPYSVLKSERERASAAHTLATEMADRVRTLEAALAAAANGAKPGAAARAAAAATADAPVISDADLEALKDDFPTVYKAMQAQMALTRQLEAQLQDQKGFRQEIEEASTRDIQETIQDVIDANPKLAHVQANDPDTFALASQFDDTLKSHAAWKDKPMSERFAKVIEMVEQTNGAITVPGSKPSPKPAPTATDLKAAAKAAAAAQAQANASTVPTSLSEFPVGDPPAQTETEALSAMSHQALAEKFSKMTPEQMDAYLATI